MLRAIDIAGGHHTHPNPSVGAVVVSSEGRVVGEGSHLGPGEDHAEVVALRAAGEATHGSDLYVTLEPCSFHGRTPPCVDAIQSAGVGRVFVGAIDPDVRVSGAGVERLLERGIQVMVWEESEEAETVDPAYFHQRRTGRSRVTLKYAMTLDGSVAAADGTSQWISSAASRRDAHMLRSQADAVVVGAGTLRSDDPLLDVRLDGYDGHQPRPVVVAGKDPLPTSSRLWDRDPLVVTTSAIKIPAGDLVEVKGEDFPDPLATARALGELGYLECLLEGGARLAGAWWGAGVIDRGVIYVGARIGGGEGLQPLGGDFDSIGSAIDVKVVDVRTVGADVRIEFGRTN